MTTERMMNKDKMIGLMEWRRNQHKMLGRDGPREILERQILIQWHEIYFGHGKDLIL